MSGPRYQSNWDEPEEVLPTRSTPEVVVESVKADLEVPITVVGDLDKPKPMGGDTSPAGSNPAGASRDNPTARPIGPVATLLAKTFRAERRRRQWSQRTMAAALGLALGTYCRIEDGNGCTVTILDRACAILDWVLVIRGAPK